MSFCEIGVFVTQHSSEVIRHGAKQRPAIRSGSVHIRFLPCAPDRGNVLALASLCREDGPRESRLAHEKGSFLKRQLV
jgi:hypothetical protein